MWGKVRFLEWRSQFSGAAGNINFLGVLAMDENFSFGWRNPSRLRLAPLFYRSPDSDGDNFPLLQWQD